MLLCTTQRGGTQGSRSGEAARHALTLSSDTCAGCPCSARLPSCSRRTRGWQHHLGWQRPAVWAPLQGKSEDEIKRVGSGAAAVGTGWAGAWQGGAGVIERRSERWRARPRHRGGGAAARLARPCAPLPLLRLRHRCLHFDIGHSLRMLGSAGLREPAERWGRAAGRTGSTGRAELSPSPQRTHLCWVSRADPCVHDPAAHLHQVGHADWPDEADLLSSEWGGGP